MIRKALAAICLAASIGACSPPTVDGGRYGTVRFFKPAGAIRGFVVMFSDAAGWTSADDTAARALARQAAMVVGVDTNEYLQNLLKDSDPRLYLVADVGTISQQLERKVGNSNYETPILAGIGEGGALAELILAQAGDQHPMLVLDIEVHVDDIDVNFESLDRVVGLALRRRFLGEHGRDKA